MRHLLLYSMFAALRVFHVNAVKWNRRSNFVGDAFRFREEDLAPFSTLRQTTWKEINDRQVSRANPNYKRQMVSAIPDAPSPTGTASYGLAPRSDCSCGYFMSEHNNTYYPLAILADFAEVTSLEKISALDLIVVNGRIGGVNKDDKITTCRSDPANFRFTSDGILQLVVPGKSSRLNSFGIFANNCLLTITGGQSKGGVITGAQLRSREMMTSGHLSMTTRISPVHGTCQSLFTYIDEANFPKAGDEQDIEIRGQLLDRGIQLTNWNPASYHVQSESTWHPFPSPPTIAFHNYTIFWPPADASPRQTSYYFDGQLLKTFDKYVSVNPSRASLSNWSNGASFTQGPPVEDAVLEVAGLAWYYSTAAVPGLPSGCTMEHACRV